MIEERINNLNRILGPLNDKNDDRAENLTDSLISANTLVASALSGREKINDVIARSDELEQYMDPEFVENQSDVKAKEVYVHTVAPELAESFELLEEIKKLEPCLGAEYFRNIPDATDTLKKMNETTGEQTSQNDLLEEGLILAMQRYSEIQEGIKDALKNMNDRLDHLEDKLKAKKKSDDDV